MFLGKPREGAKQRRATHGDPLLSLKLDCLTIAHFDPISQVH
jgi:hypothetical protein